MSYRHLTQEERYRIAALRVEGLSQAEIARRMRRSASTISREVKRNAYPTDGRYRAEHAHSMARGRRWSARRGSHFSAEEWRKVESLLRRDYSPEQVSGRMRMKKSLRISHETIYRHVWHDKYYGGDLYKHLRGSRKQRRKRYGKYDSRGRLAGKRMIGQRPKIVDSRKRIGDWEVDTVMGQTKACIVTLVERKSGYVEIGRLKDRTVKQTNARLKKLIARHPGQVITVTADNGCEFHGYRALEKSGDVLFYFANPHHSWERGTNENTNGLIRQYLPKRTSMADLTQARCNAIAEKLNSRPRKRLGFQTPKEIFLGEL